MITRRNLLFTAFCVATTANRVTATGVPKSGSIVPNLGTQHVAVTTRTVLDKAADGFEFRAQLTPGSGTPGDGWYAVGQHISLQIDTEKAPGCEDGARALIGQQVRLVLTRA